MMEKEKQAYYQLKELYAGKPTWSALAEMADSGDLLDIVATFIEEHETEIAALKAEIEWKDCLINKAIKTGNGVYLEQAISSEVEDE